MSFQISDRMFWPGGRTKALTFSYDDGVSQDLPLIELFNHYKVKATFNLNAGLLGDQSTVETEGRKASHDKLPKQDLPTVYAGHEPASHGQIHCCMYGMDTGRCAQEILTCRAELESIFQRPLIGFAYAFGTTNATIRRALSSCGIAYGRTIRSTHSFDIPEDFLMWDPTCHHDDGQLFSLADSFLSDKNYFSFFSPAKLFYVWGHSYEFDQNNNWARMERFLQKISGHEDVWYASNEEIYSYVTAYKRLIFSADSKFVYNPTSTPVWLGGMFQSQTVKVSPGQYTQLLPPLKI